MSARKDLHAQFMAECLRLAKKGEGRVSPNPLVGAILVKNNRIVARGFHKKFGGPHAEVECLGGYRGDLTDATLYVNLEPCCYRGKTPPCTDLIIRSGIGRVVVGMKDPNPRVSGKGIRALRRENIHVVEGVLEQESSELNKKFTKHITTGLPYVHLKVAQTLDCKISISNGKRRWISSAPSRKLVHAWRAEYDAVLVGAGTVSADNPQLTVRSVRGRDPDVVVLDGRLTVSPGSRLFRKRVNRRVFLCVDAKFAARKKRKVELLRRRGVEILRFVGSRGRIRLRKLLKELYRSRIGSILVEGGSDINTQFLREGVVDEMSIFLSPSIMGEGVPNFATFKPSPDGTRIKRITAQPVGRDILLQAHFG
jgi:diaminohydroxyphosphoribosylaminopyrimidine deaminase/5-amino-6-(5-phosphoribosylamino)uracil reductase